MKNLTKAIFSQLSGSTLNGLVGRRIYKGSAPPKTAFPYVVFSVISDTQDDTFKSKISDVLIQVDLYSTDRSSSEIEDMYDALKTALDDAQLVITGATQCLFKRDQMMSVLEDIPATPTGTNEVWHYAVDYNIIMERN